MNALKRHLNLVLTLSCILLFLLAFWVNDPFQYFESTYENSDLMVVDIEQAEIAKIEIQNKSILQLSLIKETPSNDSWKVRSGKDDGVLFPADPSLIKKAVEKLYSVRKYQEVTRNKEKHLEFKVAPEDLKLLLYKKQQTKPTISLYLGKSGSGFNSTLVRLEGEDTVYSAKGSLKSDWEHDVNHFRNKSLFKLSPENILSYSIQGEYNYSITKDESGKWEINLPAVNVTSPADKTKVNDILEKIVKLEGNDFYEEKVYQKQYATITIYLTSKDELRLETVGPIEGDFLVKSTSLPSWMKISKWKVEDIIVKPDGLMKKEDPKKVEGGTSIK